MRRQTPNPENLLICLRADCVGGVTEVTLEDLPEDTLEISDFYEELPRLKEGAVIFTAIKRLPNLATLTAEQEKHYLAEKLIFDKIRGEYGIH